MKKLLIVTATALGVALGGMAPAFAAPAQPTFDSQLQLAQAKKDDAGTKGKKKMTKKKGAGKKTDGGEKKKAKAKGKDKKKST